MHHVQRPKEHQLVVITTVHGGLFSSELQHQPSLGASGSASERGCAQRSAPTRRCVRACTHLSLSLTPLEVLGLRRCVLGQGVSQGCARSGEGIHGRVVVAVDDDGGGHQSLQEARSLVIRLHHAVGQAGPLVRPHTEPIAE